MNINQIIQLQSKQDVFSTIIKDHQYIDELIRNIDHQQFKALEEPKDETYDNFKKKNQLEIEQLLIERQVLKNKKYELFPVYQKCDQVFPYQQPLIIEIDDDDI